MSRSVIKEFSCFFVQNFSHSGTLVLFPDHLVFLYANRSEDKDTFSYYASIKDVEVETRLAKTVNSLSIITNTSKLVFSGLQDAESLKEYILLLKKCSISSSEITTGFSSAEESDEYTYSELQNPTLLCSYSIPTQFETLLEYIEGIENQKKFVESIGNEDVEISDWTQHTKHKERTLKYTKIVVLPVLGRNLIKVIEYHHMFKFEGKIVIAIETDLGTTPYSDCFSPFVQIFFADNGDSVEYYVKFEIVWSSTPFVKSIIENKTVEEFRTTYSSIYYKQLIKDLTGQDVAAEKTEETPKVERTADVKFKKFKTMYKVLIIILFLLLFVSIVRYNWPEDGFHWDFKRTYTLLVSMFFVFVLMYY